ncbi:MAG: hypothetical protein KAT48_09435 [Bacteroidales bacterium]|nr:hypothetical protein [Bacteroidales bacterium]
MKNDSVIKNLSKVLFLILAPLLMCFSTNAQERPENVTSFEIQKSQKETYKIVLQSLKSLEYEINRKVKNKFIKGSKGEELVLVVAPYYSALRYIYNVEIWLNSKSEEKTMVYIHVIKKSYSVEDSVIKEITEKNNRSESTEKNIHSEVEKILKKL